MISTEDTPRYQRVEKEMLINTRRSSICPSRGRIGCDLFGNGLLGDSVLGAGDITRISSLKYVRHTEREGYV